MKLREILLEDRELEEIDFFKKLFKKIHHVIHGNWLSKHQIEQSRKKRHAENAARGKPAGWAPAKPKANPIPLKKPGVIPHMVWAVNSGHQIFYRRGRKGDWTRVRGAFDAEGLKQISHGPVGTFGVNKYDDIYFRVGTHEDNNSAGTGWQKLPGKLSQISAGKNTVWGVHNGKISCLTPQFYYADNFKGYKIDFSKSNWQSVPGELMQISASKDSDVIWGVAKGGRIWYKDGIKGKGQLIPGSIPGGQVAVGNGGVYGVTSNHEVYYRNGTKTKPNSKGTGWTRVPGRMKYVASGRNAIWAVNSRHEIYAATANGANLKWVIIPGGLKQVSAA